MLNNHSLDKQRAYTLIWVMLLLMLLTFLSANLYEIYSQKLIFDKSFKSKINNSRLIKQHLNFCENKLLMAYEKELQLVDIKSVDLEDIASVKNKSSEAELLASSVTQAELALSDLTESSSIQFKSSAKQLSVEIDLASSISAQQPHDFRTLFNVSDMRELHQSFNTSKFFNQVASGSTTIVKADTQSAAQNTPHSFTSPPVNKKTKQCFYYNFAQLSLKDYFQEVEQLDIVEHIKSENLAQEALFKVYIYASIYDHNLQQHSLLRSNYILAPLHKLIKIERSQGFLQRQALINLSGRG